MLAAHLWVGYPLLPLNALFSIVVCRVVVAWLVRRGWLQRYLSEIAVACGMLAIWLDMLWEYGSIGIAYAVLGALVRHEAPARLRIRYGCYCLVLFLAVQLVGMEYTLAQQAVIVAGTTATVWYLIDFTVVPHSLAALPFGCVRGMQWLARHSLYYYAVHRIFLQTVGVYGMDVWPLPRCVWLAGVMGCH
jgi:hypothetical protein